MSQLRMRVFCAKPCKKKKEETRYFVATLKAVVRSQNGPRGNTTYTSLDRPFLPRFKWTLTTTKHVWVILRVGREQHRRVRGEPKLARSSRLVNYGRTIKKKKILFRERKEKLKYIRRHLPESRDPLMSNRRERDCYFIIITVIIF